MISLFAFQNTKSCTIKALSIQKLSKAAMCFYLQYKQNKVGKNTYYWRLVGESNQNLLSLEINDGLIHSIEILAFDHKKIAKYPTPYTQIGKIEKYTPHLYLLPTQENKTNINGIYFDSYIDFFASSYSNAFKIFWGEKVHIAVFICDHFSLELSENNELIGITIHQNLEDSFNKNEVDLTLYHEQ